ncbi:DUF805 domain-containing protein [Cryobacterium melibiosiphilum]|uniref:DUF805 domain-containing protein n=1 Tax=Cryobacterium melibiosiphilum TaxID=995039 RepID=A0A3A5MP45_9MICO|nr:DUF805 domain-containing protein [Cryobacterium melibiosiphilum]RJT90851.1 DUF805 domain-containing protein [Cryobacterium melibiosiphilum]
MRTPMAAVSTVLSRYATFSGRAARSEYWWWALAVGVLLMISGALIIIPTGQDVTGAPEMGLAAIGVPLYLLVVFGLLVPNIAVTVRRLHDANFSGWFYLLVFAFGIGGLVVFVLTLLPSNPAGARFDKLAAPNAAPTFDNRRIS